MHGGLSPSSLTKAQMALAALRNPAIEILFNALTALHEIIEQWRSNTCPHCMYPIGNTEEKEAIIKAAANAAKSAALVLDRTGLGPKATVEVVTQSDGTIDLRQLTLEERAELAALLAQVRDFKSRVMLRIAGALPMKQVNP